VKVALAALALAALLAGCGVRGTCPPGTFLALDGFCTHNQPAPVHPRR